MGVFDPAVFDPLVFDTGVTVTPRVAFALRFRNNTFVLEETAMGGQSFTAGPQDPSDREIYSLECPKWLQQGETIASFSVQSLDPGLEVSGAGRQGSTIRWRVSGGISGRNHRILVSVTSSLGRRAERTITVRVRNL